MQNKRNQAREMMNVQEKISKYRTRPFIAIVLSAIVSSVFLCVINALEFDEISCVLFVILGFMPVIYFELEYERRRNMIANNPQTDYTRIAVGFGLCCGILFITSFMPEFCRPVMLFPLIMIAFSNETLGMAASLFFNILLAMTTGGSFNELLTYVVMTIIACVLSKALHEAEYAVWIGWILLFCNILFPCVFCYWSSEKLSIMQLLFGIFNGIITAVYAIRFYPKVVEETKQELVFRYDTILSKDYFMVKEIYGYSSAEYLHARRLSEISLKYARVLGLNETLAEAAGFYYRLGRLEGDPVVENGVKKAEELCFPQELIQILREYQAEKELPSTPESALIHMLDAVLLKKELLSTDIGSSKWNREVLIFQTLNELSTAGIYEKSGLGINAFLKIREMLAKEELLS